MNTLEEGFALLGLSKREAAVLFCVCVFGRQSIASLAKQSRLPRTTVDAIVHRLSHRGLLQQFPYGKREKWGIPADFTVYKSKIEAVLAQIEASQQRIAPD